MFNKFLKIRTQNKLAIIAILAIVFTLFLALVIFIYKSLHIVSETNKNNFEQNIKVRDAIEEVDIIIERSELNVNVLASIVANIYDEKKLYDKNYNLNFLDSFSSIIKSVFYNSPGIDGVWFQLNHESPFTNDGYNWYGIIDGKPINIKEYLFKGTNNPRKLTPQDDPYYFEALEYKNIAKWSKIYLDKDTNKKMISVVRSIYKDKKLIGVVGIDITMDNLQDAVDRMHEIFNDADVYLVDKTGKVILFKINQNINFDLDQKKIIGLLNKKNDSKNAMIEYFDNKTRKTAILLALSSMDYSIVVAFPNEVIYKGFNNLFFIVYLVFILLIIMIIITLLRNLKVRYINKQLEEKTNNLNTILESSPNLIISKNIDGTYKFCNKAFLDAMGLKKEEIIGKTATDVFGPKQAENIQHADTIAKIRKKVYQYEESYTNKNGKLYYLKKYVIPLLDANNNLTEILIIAINITDTKNKQELLKDAKNAAEKTSQIKSDFLANMSHEIRTPLNGVLGFLQLLKDTNLNEEQLEFINDAEKSSDLLLSIINNILDFSKLEAGKLIIESEVFNLESIAEDAIIISAPMAQEKGLEINVLIHSDSSQKVIGSPAKIKQILINLISNAIKFTPTGEILLTLELIESNNDEVVAVFEVKDTGIGIPKNKLDLIFEKFTQIDPSRTRKYGGTGLGLSISRKLAELMNGKIEATSTPGEGSSFKLTLNLKKANNGINQPDKDLILLKDKKILIVSDNVTDLKILNQYLKQFGCIIYEANSCQNAIEIIDKEALNLSLIIADHNIKHFECESLHPLIKIDNNENGIPIIIFSSIDNVEILSQIKKRGFGGIMTKPIIKSVLINSVLNIIKESGNANLNKHQSTISNKFVKNMKILVAEDTDLNSKLLSKLLEREGIKYDIAQNGEKAIKYFRTNKYDLILMDCQMPVLNGYEATKKIRKIEKEQGLKEIPIIAMTANALSDDKDKCSSAGMNDYINKPIDFKHLIDLIIKHTNKLENKPEIKQAMEDMKNELNFQQAEIEELIFEFFNFIPKILQEIETSLKENDFKALTQLSHKLKGASMNLRLKEFAGLAQKMEELAKNKDTKEYTNCLNQLKNMVEITSLVCFSP